MNTAPEQITVFLAEDMHMVRGALRALLDLEPDIRVVGETARGDDVLASVDRLRPTVAVIDIDLPGIDGLAAAARGADVPDIAASLFLSPGPSATTSARRPPSSTRATASTPSGSPPVPCGVDLAPGRRLPGRRQ